MTTNPNFFGQSTTGTPSKIEDGVDFPHTGLFKGLSNAASGRYSISGFNTSSVTASSLTVAAGVIMYNGKRLAITGADLTLSTTYSNGYHLLVAPKPHATTYASVVVLRTPTAANKVPAYVTGDTIIAVLTHTGSSDLHTQYLTYNKVESSLSIAHKGSGEVYTEVGTIQGTAAGIFLTGDVAKSTPVGGDKILIKDSAASDVIKTVTVASIVALAPQGDITGVDLSEGTGIDIASEANTASGAYSATINLNLTEITVGAGLDNPAATTLNLDLTEVIASDGANRVLTSDGDGTLTAESSLTVTTAVTSITSGITQINKSLALMPQGGIGFVADTPIMYISDANNILQLPAASNHTNQMVIIKNMKGTNLTITITGGDRFEDNQTYSKDSRWVDVSNVRLLPLQSIRLQAVDDGSIVIPIAAGDDTMATGWMIVDNTTIDVDTVYTHPNHSGEVTSTGDGATVITNGAVIADRIATDAVITAKILNANVTTAKIADDAVTGDKLANNIDIAGTLDVTGVTTLDDNLTVATAKTLLARRLPVVALNASTTLTEADHAGRYVFIIGGSRVITLPDNQGAGVHFTIINNDGNGFTLRTGTNSITGDLMNGSDDDIAVAARNGVTCISTGTDYVVLGV